MKLLFDDRCDQSQEMKPRNEWSQFFKKTPSMVFDKFWSFDFWPLILAGNKFATAVKETLLFISNFPKFVSLMTCDNTSC